MRLIGLTGGIASGKSTVSQMLRELGAHVLDADGLAREVVAPGTAGLAEVAARFPGVVAPDGTLDRSKLGERVFNDDRERAALNALLHPRIQAAFAQHTRALEERGVEVVVYDAPLLIENGLHALMEAVIVVDAPEATQLQRLMARNGLSLDQARARLGSQLPAAEKRRHARWVIDNSGDIESTRAQVKAVWSEIEGSGKP